MTTPELLRNCGLLPSPQRVAIYDLLHDHPVHQTAEMIFAALKPQMPALSLATVYNTLRRLRDRGALRELVIEPGVLRYDANLPVHGHFLCTGCGQVFDLWPEDGRMPPVPGLPEGFSVSELSLCCRGLCAKCRRQK